MAEAPTPRTQATSRPPSSLPPPSAPALQTRAAADTVPRPQRSPRPHAPPPATAARFFGAASALASAPLLPQQPTGRDGAAVVEAENSIGRGDVPRSSSFERTSIFAPAEFNARPVRVTRVWSSRRSAAVTASQPQQQHRLIRRDAPFHQSSGTVYMHRSHGRAMLLSLASKDWYHSALMVPAFILFSAIIGVYTLVILLFAGLYVILDNYGENCGLAQAGQAPTFNTAFAFSLETMTTIGYGIPFDTGDFFESCGIGLFLVYMQTMASLMLNAFMVGILFGRMSRATKKAHEIIFSRKACIRCVRDRFYFMVQICEASFFRFRPVVGARLRLYAVLHERDGRFENERDAAAGARQGHAAFFQTRVMRLTNPNDELGGTLFLATPQVVSHRIDPWSPLFPPSARCAEGSGYEHDGTSYHFPGLVFREADREVALSDEQRGPSTRAQPSVPGEAPDQNQLLHMRDAIARHIEASCLEVIVVVEAIDPASSHTFQARHSYTASDIAFDETFEPCMSIADDGIAKLRWDCFHTTRPVAFNTKRIIGSSHS